jgi:hypothetical protein
MVMRAAPGAVRHQRMYPSHIHRYPKRPARRPWSIGMRSAHLALAGGCRAWSRPSAGAAPGDRPGRVVQEAGRRSPAVLEARGRQDILGGRKDRRPNVSAQPVLRLRQHPLFLERSSASRPHQARTIADDRGRSWSCAVPAAWMPSLARTAQGRPRSDQPWRIRHVRPLRARRFRPQAPPTAGRSRPGGRQTGRSPDQHPGHAAGWWCSRS